VKPATVPALVETAVDAEPAEAPAARGSDYLADSMTSATAPKRVTTSPAAALARTRLGSSTPTGKAGSGR